MIEGGLTEALEKTKEFPVIFDSFVKADEILNKKGFNNIAVSISGGSDSDIMMDMCERVSNKPLRYVWFDTGVEFNATKEHLDFLEEKYGVKIEREPPVLSVPASVKKYGIPFLSKYASEQISRLQRHNFEFKDNTYEEDYKTLWEVDSALKWYHNQYTSMGVDGNPRVRFNIGFNRFLREFLISNPPKFTISNKCCEYSKKLSAKNYIEDNDIELELVGVRKAEGGVRAHAYKDCFDDRTDASIASYRPLFWYKNQDKEDYNKIFGVTNSRCYTEYGMERTGCVGCPYNNKILQELKILKKYEPHLYKAAMNMFGEAYVYTKQYRDFYKEMKEKESSCQT